MYCNVTDKPCRVSVGRIYKKLLIMEVKDVEKVYEVHHDKKDKEYASKGMAGTALGLGIAGTALGLGLFGNGNGLNLFGNRCNNNGNCGCNEGPTAFQAWEKECEDNVALTAAIYQGRIVQLNERFSDRQTINGEMFGLYKNQRDQFDVLKGELDNLKCAVAVNTAIRPYQDQIINLSIMDARKDAAYDLERRTCRMIQGEVVLPSTPTVTGFPSYSCCGRITTAQPGA